MVDWHIKPDILFLIAIALVWWYAPKYISHRYAVRARIEIDPIKRRDLLDWAIFYDHNPHLRIELSRTIFEIAQTDKDPHERLRQATIAGEIIDGLIRRGAIPDDFADEAARLLGEIKRYETAAKVISDMSAENARKRFKVM